MELSMLRDLYIEERYDEVVSALKGINPLQVDDEDMVFAAADSCLQTGHLQEGMMWYEKLVQLSPDRLYMEELVKLYRREGASGDKWHQLELLAEEYGEGDIAEAAAYQYHKKTGTDAEELIELLIPVLKNARDDAELLFEAADLCRKMGNESKRIYYLKKIVNSRAADAESVRRAEDMLNEKDSPQEVSAEKPIQKAGNKSDRQPSSKKQGKGGLLHSLKGIKSAKLQRTERIVDAGIDSYFRNVVGMKKIKEEVTILYDNYNMVKSGHNTGRLFPWNFLIGGEKGSGKKMLANILAEILCGLGRTSKNETKVISAVQVLNDPEILLDSGSGGDTVIVTDTEILVDDSDKSSDRNYDTIWTLISNVLDDAVRGQNRFYIFIGERDAMKRVMEKNPKLTTDYMTYLDIPVYNVDELFQIGKQMIMEDGYRMTSEAETRFFRLIQSESVRDDFANMHSLKRILRETYKNVTVRYRKKESTEELKMLQEQDFIIEDKAEESLEELLEQLESLPGLHKVKEEVKKKIDYFEYREMMRKKGDMPDEAITLHTLLLGPPGTGKTTVARLIGKIYGCLGILPRSDIFHERTRVDLVGKHVGETAPKVEKAVKEAMGGILFLDEAYDLVHTKNEGSDPYGEEALTALMKYAEDYRDRLMIIMAGYEKEMFDFMNVNPGMNRRFPEDNRLHFEDYSDDELYDIFLYMIKSGGYLLDDEAVEPVKQLIKRKRKLKGYENAGGVRNIYDGLKQAVASRVVETREEIAEELHTIKVEDIKRYADGVEDQYKTLEDYLDELNGLIGLQRVKDDVNEKIKYLKYVQMRKEAGIEKDSTITLHTLFLGNPGTGKTTVARLLGKIYGRMGLLPDGDKFKEVLGSELIKGFVGQTGGHVKEVIEEAMGGVLFIDEAHNIISGGQNGGFGKDALAALVPMIENNRDKLMVIMAGYEGSMEELLKYDPGLGRRFPNRLYFEDYSEEELYSILLYILREKGLFPDKDTEDGIKELIRKRKAIKDFGNAGEMRNLAEELMKTAGSRVTGMEEKLDARELQRITREDVGRLLG